MIVNIGKQQLPLVKGLPLIGNFFDLIDNPYPFLVKTYQKAGPIYRVGVLGRVLTILGGPEANLFVAKEGINYLTNAEAYTHFSQEFGIYHPNALDGSIHLQCRHELAAIFTEDMIALYAKRMILNTIDFVQKWQEGQQIDVFHVLRKLTYLQMNFAAFHGKLEDCCKELDIFVQTLINVSRKRIMPERSLRSSVYLTAKKRVYASLKNLLNERRQTKLTNDQPDILDILLTKSDHDGQPFSDEKIISYMSTLLLEDGTGIVTSLAAFMLYEILKNPKLYRQVLTEVSASFANGIPDLKSFRQMEVLRGALMETLRLYPITGMVERYVKHPFDFAGYRVESGQIISTAQAISHFLPEFYPEPYTFDADRYRSPRQEHKQPGAFAPFGLKPHVCLGAGLAEIQLMLTVAIILYAVQPQLEPPTYTMKKITFAQNNTLLTAKERFYIKVGQRSLI